jgi:hypothetical protein
MRLSLLVRLIIEFSAQQMSQANDPLAEKELQIQIPSMSNLSISISTSSWFPLPWSSW